MKPATSNPEPTSWPPPPPHSAIAVLISGGLDSAVLLGESLQWFEAVFPVYISTGSYWESVERLYLDRFLNAVAQPKLRPLKVLRVPTDDLYDDHWSMTGVGSPHFDAPDEAVYLPGRNVILLSKAMIWCHLQGIPFLATAPLDANPFPDATPDFVTRYQSVVNQAIDGSVQIIRPYIQMNKVSVIRRGKHLPLQHTFSCVHPIHDQHCGACNKCAERQFAFRDAAVADPTHYARPRSEKDSLCSV
ncbi:7-cyano-7-deazaguanine synthase [Tuwongella immobilis]|nr:7-cyano-7-deazaguanine synthase [Tuwongella immobilis]